ncbi:hypothetical protein RI367_006020 [Sorochytrium milnesiophthora]
MPRSPLAPPHEQQPSSSTFAAASSPPPPDCPSPTKRSAKRRKTFRRQALGLRLAILRKTRKAYGLKDSKAVKQAFSSFLCCSPPSSTASTCVLPPTCLSAIPTTATQQTTATATFAQLPTSKRKRLDNDDSTSSSSSKKLAPLDLDRSTSTSSSVDSKACQVTAAEPLDVALPLPPPFSPSLPTSRSPQQILTASRLALHTFLTLLVDNLSSEQQDQQKQIQKRSRRRRAHTATDDQQQPHSHLNPAAVRSMRGPISQQNFLDRATRLLGVVEQDLLFL